MNFLNLLLQLFFDLEARKQAEKFREAGLRAAVKGRRVAIAGVFFLISGAFFFSGIVLGLIDLGLQIDRQNGVGFSGLMLSSLLLLLIGLMGVLAGWIFGRDPQEESRRIRDEEVSSHPPRNELRDALENLAVMFIKEFAENQKAARAEKASQQQSSN